MKKTNLIIKGLGVAALALVACDNTYDPVPLEYEKDPNFGAPELQEGWQLEEVPGMCDVAGVYGYKDVALNKLFTRNFGWNGGDGGLTLKLPDGNVYWDFNDSFYGVVDPETRARGTSSFPRNSVMIQTMGEDGLPGMNDENLIWMNPFINLDNPDGPNYGCARTFLEHPKAVSYNDQGIAQDYVYWAGDATIVDNQLQMLWMGVYSSQLRQESTALAIYSLDGKPGDPGYMKEVSVDHNFMTENPWGYGSTLCECADGHIYLYATKSPAFLANNTIVARTTTMDLRSEWEYFVPTEDGMGNMWSKEYPTEDQVNKVNISSSAISMPWVFERDGWYYMVGQGYPYSADIMILRAKDPWGPFTDSVKLFTLPPKLDKIGDQTSFHYYMINLHESLSREGELVFSTNSEVVDPLNFWNNFNEPGSADFYRLFYYRIYNWERIYK